jgi:hypothetical protein
MFDNLTGTVGTLMHEDRLAQATRNLQLAEAEQSRRRGTSRHDIRAFVAGIVLDLATRLTPIEGTQTPLSAP